MAQGKNLAEMKAEIMKECPARTRLTSLFDEGNYTELDVYANASVITAYGYVEGTPVYAFSQNMTENSGAMSEAQCKKIKKVYDLASKTGVPVVGIYDSYGAVMTDGVKAMSAYGELMMWTANLSGVVPQISVVAGTCASSNAMLATSADFVVMAKNAELFITPNTKETNYAENSAKSGTVAVVCDDDIESVMMARNILCKMPMNNLASVPLYEFEAPEFIGTENANDMVTSIADVDSIIEMYKDFGTSAYTALASVGGATVGFVATNKNDSKLTHDDCSKIARFVRTCDAYAVPVVTMVDTEGFAVSDEAEVMGSLRDMTKLAHSYAEATTAKISIVTGKAYGSAYIALAGKGANADVAYAYQNAVISPVAPLTAVEFLKHDELKGAENLTAKREELAKEYALNEGNPINAAAENCIDDVIEAVDTRAVIISALEMTAGKRVSRMPKKHSNMPL